MTKTDITIRNDDVIILDQIKTLDELLCKFSQQIDKIENELMKYKGQFVIIDDSGQFMSELLCLCGDIHITAYNSQKNAESTLAKSPLQYPFDTALGQRPFLQALEYPSG